LVCLQAVFHLAKLAGVLNRLSDKQLLVLFLGALCHDLEHPVRCERRDVCLIPAKKKNQRTGELILFQEPEDRCLDRCLFI
jgi:hypothetical protein